MSVQYGLGCVEFAVPGTTLEEKLVFLEKRKMWLELVNDGTKTARMLRNSLSITRARALSVQAYRLHDLQLLSQDLGETRAALKHVRESVEMAANIGAGHVVTTIAYGTPKVPDALPRCIRIFRGLGEYAEEREVVVGIEPLGRKRTTFLPGLSDVVDLVERVDSDFVRPMADTMHIHDNGDPVHGVIAGNLHLLSEVQLRDTDSLPPGAGGLDFKPVAELLKRYRGLVCVEYKPRKNPKSDFELALRTMKSLTARVRR